MLRLNKLLFFHARLEIDSVMQRSLEVAEDSGILDRIIPADLAEKTRQA